MGIDIIERVWHCAKQKAGATGRGWKMLRTERTGMGGPGTKVQDGGPEVPRKARRALRARDLGWEGRRRRLRAARLRDLGWAAGPGGGAERWGQGGATRAVGRCTCFRGSCRDSSSCWAAARVSAPPRSHPPRCSLAPFHPHPAIPARKGASRRPLNGPVSPPNRSPAAVQSSVARLLRLPALAYLRSAGFPGSQPRKLDRPLIFLSSLTSFRSLQKRHFLRENLTALCKTQPTRTSTDVPSVSGLSPYIYFFFIALAPTLCICLLCLSQ